MQCATASSAPTASSSTFTWEDMTNYVGQSAVFQTAFISGDTNKTATIVLSVVEPLLKKGRTLWMDNFHNSPALAQRLKSLKTDCVGTLRLSRKDVPQRVKEKKLKKRRTGSSTFRTGVRSEVERQKRCDNDFYLPWRGNKNEANKM